MELVVSVSPSGGVRSMHDDRFPMGFLGKQQIKRASDIRWNEEEQTWEIWWYVRDDEFEGFAEPAEPYRYFHSYELAREFEVNIMNCSLRTGYHPISNEMLLEATLLRDRE